MANGDWSPKVPPVCMKLEQNTFQGEILFLENLKIYTDSKEILLNNFESFIYVVRSMDGVELKITRFKALVIFRSSG